MSSRLLTATVVVAALAATAQAERPPGATRADTAIAELRDHLAPAGSFVVWGGVEGDRGNPTLRADIDQFATVAQVLAVAADRDGATSAARAQTAAQLRRLLADYRRFVAAHWPIGAATKARFVAADRAIVDALAPVAAAPPPNPYLDKVDAAIADPAWRAAIRAVQPAVVKLGGGTGVNLDRSGLIVTAGHVVDAVGRRLTVRFPDGREFTGVTIRFDAEHDLGLVALDGASDLPTAALAAAPPAIGADVVVIGQPGRHTPDGEATGYQPWHVSTGTLRGYRSGPRTGGQHLGRAKHDAWTYWGHSGSPLFDRSGAIVALHNSWDSRTAMRHAVTWEALRAFLAP